MMTMGAEQCLQDVPAALAQGQRLDVFPATTEVISDILALFWRAILSCLFHDAHRMRVHGVATKEV